MSDFWHKLGCCVVEKPQPQQRKRRRIDRTMIGEPMNFIHLTHIGSGDMVNEGLPAVEPSRKCDPNADEKDLGAIPTFYNLLEVFPFRAN